tara:strand:+ start:10 stop:531 length:522 start_codon:yes stop_codon:yes gene_type:complete
MIISCNNCKKKFYIDSILIPEKGRLLQCNDCNHRWFFKKEIISETSKTKKPNESDEKIIALIDRVEPIKIEKSETIELLDKTIKNNFVKEEITIKSTNKVDDFLELHKSKNINKKNYNILSYIIVFIVSFMALIIVLDTFQGPISNIIPNIEFLLYNLYETIYDVVLFFRDLI